MSARETVELVTGEKYFSTDHWVTIWQSRGLGRSHRKLLSKPEIDRVRYIALVAHGGGRDDVDGRGEGAGPVGGEAKKGGAR